MRRAFMGVRVHSVLKWPGAVVCFELCSIFESSSITNARPCASTTTTAVIARRKILKSTLSWHTRHARDNHETTVSNRRGSREADL